MSYPPHSSPLPKQDDLTLPPVVGKLHAGPFLWLAPPGHYEYNHVDPDDGMLMIMSGSKRVRLYSPDQIHKVYPNPLGSKGRTLQSQVDCDAPDLEQFPEFASATVQECIVGAGDALFIPAFTWHQVQQP